MFERNAIGGERSAPNSMPNLKDYRVTEFRRGAPKVVELVWMLMQALFVRSSIPGTLHRRWLLRLFGAHIGHGVVIKPGVRIKFPWRLEVGDHSWIGEDVWIDNLAKVSIGSNVCISQAAYLCTGSHDWSSIGFTLITKPMFIEDGAWVAAGAAIAPGVRVGEGAVLGFGAVAQKDLSPWTIYTAATATKAKDRRMSD